MNTKKMESLTELYRVGFGPSSSHTMGPERACRLIKEKYPTATAFRAILYGSLSKTGKGHGTDVVIKKTLSPTPCEVEFSLKDAGFNHPNTFDLLVFEGEDLLNTVRIESPGGGKINLKSVTVAPPKAVYPHRSFDEIKSFCKEKSITLPQYADLYEGEGLDGFLLSVWRSMVAAIERGLNDEGVLPGGLGVEKKAKKLYGESSLYESVEVRENRLVCAYAFAVSEQNASYERIVTAPTCGAAGVVPAVLYHEQKKCGYPDEKIVEALKTAGIVGNLIKTNASISGAECGCQAEVGTACAMAAAGLAQLRGAGLDKIEYSAEIAIEHHLGLTCDPICGLVQIPCIERNAVAAVRAINAVILASFLSETRKISFDKVVLAMKETGRDMHRHYKETAEGGLAKINLTNK